MSRKLKDESGADVEVLDDTEIADLRASADRAEALQAMVDASEGKSEGFKNMRTVIETQKEMIDRLKRDNKPAEKPPEPTKPVDTPPQPAFDQKAYTETARNAARGVMVEAEIDRELARYAPDQRTAMKTVFGKLTHGEELNLENYRGFLDQAARAVVGSTMPGRPSPSMGGQPPRENEQGDKPYSETEAGATAAKNLGLSYATRAPKK